MVLQLNTSRQNKSKRTLTSSWLTKSMNTSQCLKETADCSIWRTNHLQSWKMILIQTISVHWATRKNTWVFVKSLIQRQALHTLRVEKQSQITKLTSWSRTARLYQRLWRGLTIPTSTGSISTAVTTKAIKRNKTVMVVRWAEEIGTTRA